MRNFDALFIADVFDAVMTKLEAFGDHFEHLATTAEQRKLAVEFNAFVAETIQAMTPRMEDLAHLLANAAEREKAESTELHGHETWSDLFKEIRNDEAAGKREDAHPNYSDAIRKVLDVKVKAPAVEKGKDKGIER